MEALSEDTQLDTELQELYIVSSHWNSDIDFVHYEISLLKNVLNKYRIQSKNLQAEETERFYAMLEIKDAAIPALKYSVAEFIKSIEPIITHCVNNIGLELLEKFNALEAEIAHSIQYIKLVKKLVYAFLEATKNSGKYAALPIAASTTDKYRKPLNYML